MNCAWCSPSNNGSDGICDDCMRRHFGIDPASIHQEIAEEEAAAVARQEQPMEVAA
jgi:hypothetical protein